MKFERHHRILKELSISGVVKVSNLAKSLKVTLITLQKTKLLMCCKNMNQHKK